MSVKIWSFLALPSIFLDKYSLKKHTHEFYLYFMKSELTHKQARFVQEYLIDLNATQAANRAGYSAKSAARIGVELLNKTQVSQAVIKARGKMAQKAERTALDVLLDIQAVTREARANGQMREALKGLELEGRHLGMFSDRLSISTAPVVVVIQEESVA